MVAITVILAAVIGTFVLGLGDQVQDNAPQASFTFDYEDAASPSGDCDISSSPTGELTVTHDGGDKIDGADVSLAGSASNNQEWQADCAGGTDITAGSSITADAADSDTIRVVWQSGGENSATLGKWSGPEA
jgi:FlaG/FlaF family flagellin (archaellin)